VPVLSQRLGWVFRLACLTKIEDIEAAGGWQVTWGAEEWAAAGDRRRRAHAAAVLAEAAADAAGPLLMSPDLQARMLSHAFA